jgi:two-component system OmpR family response regulator
MSRILVVDDEKDVCDLLSSALRIAGYDTDVASNGEEALRLWRSRDIDLCIVDINMPVMDGFVFLETIRDQDSTTPVLMLSARDDESDIARGLRSGADDYVRKPFSLEELILRVGAILRRTDGKESDDHHYVCGPLVMNLDRHEVFYGDDFIDLSATEYRLLETLMARKNRMLTREQLLSEVWGIDFESETSVLDTYVSYLRKKINHEGFAPITTIRGVGFKLVEAKSSS